MAEFLKKLLTEGELKETSQPESSGSREADSTMGPRSPSENITHVNQADTRLAKKIVVAVKSNNITKKLVEKKYDSDRGEHKETFRMALDLLEKTKVEDDSKRQHTDLSEGAIMLHGLLGNDRGCDSNMK